MQLEMFIDEDAKKVEWDGLSRAMSLNMEQDYKILIKYPLVCINMALSERKEMTEGLRPYDEIANVVQEAIVMKTTDPSKKYQRLGTVGVGGFGEVFKVKRISDGLFFAMKVVKNV